VANSSVRASNLPAADEVALWVRDYRTASGSEISKRGAVTLQDGHPCARTAFELRARAISDQGFLRTVLAHHLNTAPTDLPIRRTPFGKPFLDDVSGTGGDVRFNMTHSGDLTAVAVTLGREVGIDVEHIRADIAFTDIAHEFFTAEEQSQLASLCPADAIQAFFRIWVRKEAVLKAIGLGIASQCPKRFHVGISGNVLAGRDGERLWVEALRLGSGYAAAVAAPEGRWRVAPWSFA
jgi:4'-phosphopantetheinyl transferase